MTFVIAELIFLCLGACCGFLLAGLARSAKVDGLLQRIEDLEVMLASLHRPGPEAIGPGVITVQFHDDPRQEAS